ncbi:hypothetical protein Tco_0802170 [Tanacetum coccineum]|uniref:Uncharacterized protein n=1 Tax=Tanacetum coccineum TaxID=301880 RepID=A0ABQ5A293_9ASTR
MEIVMAYAYTGIVLFGWLPHSIRDDTANRQCGNMTKRIMDVSGSPDRVFDFSDGGLLGLTRDGFDPWTTMGYTGENWWLWVAPLVEEVREPVEPIVAPGTEEIVGPTEPMDAPTIGGESGTWRIYLVLVMGREGRGSCTSAWMSGFRLDVVGDIAWIRDRDAQIKQISAEMISVLESEYGLMQMIATMSKHLADVEKRIPGPP